MKHLGTALLLAALLSACGSTHDTSDTVALPEATSPAGASASSGPSASAAPASTEPATCRRAATRWVEQAGMHLAAAVSGSAAMSASLDSDRLTDSARKVAATCGERVQEIVHSTTENLALTSTTVLRCQTEGTCDESSPQGLDEMTNQAFTSVLEVRNLVGAR
ncbi:hypothetical protein [Nocardioides yefusunii]|uniref:Lipoprotein n=1 Tax=Nocardioides yefusunii TaxID=2500546 RepID=A0ABW1QXA3_9ACTN|nr:hypothetical protein [Nocardioides yefusunii]